MFVLLLFFVGPLILGAHLLGASWELAILIGLVFWPALSVVAAIFIKTVEAMIDIPRRRRFEKLQRERGLVKRGSRWVRP